MNRATGDWRRHPRCSETDARATTQHSKAKALTISEDERSGLLNVANGSSSAQAGGYLSLSE